MAIFSTTPRLSTASASPKTTVGLIPQPQVAGAAFVIFLTALVVGVTLLLRGGPSLTPVEGVGVFALFYVIAQAAERGVELILPLIPERFVRLNKKLAARLRDHAFATASTAAHDPAAAGGTALSTAQTAADKQADLAQVVVNRRALAFAMTSALGMLLCGYLHADFLTTVGVDFTGRPPGIAVLQLAVTGLIVGGGSDGLHGLVTNISKASAKKDDPAETGGAS